MGSKDSHQNRMRWLDLIAAPLDGTPEFERLKEQVSANPENVKKEAKRRYEIAQASVRAQMSGGAGHIILTRRSEPSCCNTTTRTWNYGAATITDEL